MKTLLIFTFCLITAGSDAVTTVTGYRGRSVQIKCPYGSGYEKYNKYLCRGTCPYGGNKDIPVHSGSPAKDTRFSLYDDTTAKVFTVTITDLRTEDGNTYWCVIERTLRDSYTELRLLVKTLDPAITTISHTTHTTHPASTHSMSPSVHVETTHSTTANPLSDANHLTNTHDVPGIPKYIMISTGVVLLAVGVIIAIYCKIKCQETRSSTEANGDYENVQNLLPLQAKETANLPKTIYEILNLAPDQSDPVYQNLASTNKQ
ncbi:CMRF35-like molecule 5 isoform X2 [Ictalurus furcatus]|uniref:CMRF35-like molecule 5 isoform X2 n=1 Tax=Ictalurus furcatus TaxID=66913 RepID=UPI0023506098|nr:CMRF35-like molecule 5 isoform X2 [Ictalurus furcatus]